jgi:hypothetical protein
MAEIELTSKQLHSLYREWASTLNHNNVLGLVKNLDEAIVYFELHSDINRKSGDQPTLDRMESYFKDTYNLDFTPHKQTYLVATDQEELLTYFILQHPP